MFVGFLDRETRELRYRCIEGRGEEIFGTGEYGRWLVVGVLHKNDPKEELEKELKKNGVKLKLIKEILEEMQSRMEEHVYMDNARRYIQIFSTFLSREIK